MKRRFKKKLRASNSHSKELIKGSSISFVFRIFGLLTSYFFMLIISRQFGPVAMGVFSISFTLLEVMTVLGKLGLDSVMLKFSAESYVKNKWANIKYIYNKIIPVVFVFTIIMAVCVYNSGSWIVTHIFHDNNLLPSIQIISFVMLFSVIKSINLEGIRGTKDILLYSTLQRNIVNLIAIIILLTILHYKVNLELAYVNPFIAYSSSVIILSIVSTVIWLNKLKKNNTKQLKSTNHSDNVTYKKIFGIALPLMLASSMYMMMSWADVLMLGAIQSEEAVGIYHVVNKIALLSNLGIVAINTVATSKFAELYENNNQQYRNMVQKSSKIIFIVTLPIVIFIVIFREMCLGLFGDEYIEAAYALTVLALGQLVFSISGSVANILKMTGAHKQYQYILMIGLVLNLVLNYFLIHKYSYVGAAMATTTSIIFINLTCVLYIYRRDKLLTIYIPWLSHNINNSNAINE